MYVGMPAGLASLVLQAQAFFTLIFASMFLGERIRAANVAGLLIAAAGLALIGMRGGHAMTITGFLFPITAFTPAIGVGIITTAFLLGAIVALYVCRLTGRWRPTFLICSTIALYFNVFVLVVQAFLKVEALNALAPNGNEPPFAIAQGIVLLAFLTAGYLCVRRFRAVSP